MKENDPEAKDPWPARQFLEARAAICEEMQAAFDTLVESIGKADANVLEDTIADGEQVEFKDTSGCPMVEGDGDSSLLLSPC